MCKKLTRAISTLLALAMMIGVMAVSANAANITFSDVPASHWAHDAIAACAQKGIVTGMGDGTFAPDGQITYAQFATMTVNAFYLDRLDTTAAAPWYAPYTGAARRAGLLSGTAIADSDASANVPMTRYDMALVAANVLSDVEYTATDSDKSSAQASIKDWASVPAQYRDAVSTCYSLGVLNGMGDGSFSGLGTLTRAQACVVLVKLGDIIQGGSGVPTQPQPPVSGEKEIKVTLDGRAYSVADNGFTTGTLNNGLAATEENVTALLAKAQKQWPAGTTWNENTGTTLYYGTPSQVATSVIRTPYSVNVNYGCGGYAAMISDYVFGSSASARKTTVENIRPGDIVVRLRNGKAEHVFIATSRLYYDNSTRVNDAVHYTDGNHNDKIFWCTDSEMQSVTRQNQFGSDTVTWEVYTRYDNSGAPADPQSPQPPQPPVSGETEIKVECATGYYAGAYTVGDNGFATGTLNNGLAATEKNVLALLEKAKKEWPAGLVWGAQGTAGNHWYSNAGSVVRNTLLTGYGETVNYACGGYAAMISDYLFGHENNPARQTTVDKIRPGDIIVMLKDGKIDHVMIATSAPFYDDGEMVNDAVTTTDGNNNGKVNWDNAAYGESASLSFQNRWNPGWTWEVWTRYPA